MYDLVLGNSEEIKAEEDPNPKWCPEVCKSFKLLSSEVCSVESRTKRLPRDKKTLLDVPKAVKQFSSDDLIERQINEDTLSIVRLMLLRVSKLYLRMVLQAYK